MLHREFTPTLSASDLWEGLREAVTVHLSARGVQLTDVDTGFALELDANELADLNGHGPRCSTFWDRLAALGLTSNVKDIADVRRRQRAALNAATPPPLEHLRARLEEICRSVPYFRDRRAIFEPMNIATFDDFLRLPLMRKSDLAFRPLAELLPDDVDVVAGIADGSFIVVPTSNSSGQRSEVISHAMIDRLPFGADDLLNLPLRGRQPLTAFLMPPMCDRFCASRAGVAERDCYLPTARDPFAYDASYVRDIFEKLQTFDPTILAADPIYLHGVIRAARRSDVSVPSIPLIQSGFEFGTAVSIRALSEAFRCPVLNDYGASEENRLAVECHHGSLHVRCDAIYLEILSRKGPCPPGQVGALAVTTFNSLTPLVRYLIGDVGAWSSRRCDCAFSDWPVIELHGRTYDMLHGEGGPVTTLQVDRAIGAPAWLDFYQLTQTSPGRATINLVPALGARVDGDGIMAELQHLLPRQALDFRVVERLEPLPSTKFATTRPYGRAPAFI